jgi:hypothetical protein
MAGVPPTSDGQPEPLHVWDVPEGIERKRRVRDGQFDTVPGVRAFRRMLFVVAVVAVVFIVAAIVLSIASS